MKKRGALPADVTTDDLVLEARSGVWDRPARADVCERLQGMAAELRPRDGLDLARLVTADLDRLAP